MTKPSYRMLKWTFFAAIAASLGTACVVSSGDGGDTDIDDGGSSGSSSSAAGKGGGGTGGKGGSTSGGSAGTGGSSATAGGDGGSEPTGGTPATYTAGLCEDELGTMTPSSLPSCQAVDTDESVPCLVCMKAHCCTEWQACYGKDPTTACGWGATSEEDLGQFDCIQQCFTAVYDGIQNEGELLSDCQDMCLNQCEGKDDFITTGTNDLVTCTRDACLDACYPAVQ